MKEATRRSIRWAQAGLLTKICLVFVKLFAGIIGHSNALIADAVESSADIFSSLIVWMGPSIAARPADEDHPYGHGKIEAVTGLVESILLLVTQQASNYVLDVVFSVSSAEKFSLLGNSNEKLNHATSFVGFFSFSLVLAFLFLGPL